MAGTTGSVVAKRAATKWPRDLPQVDTVQVQVQVQGPRRC
jgi:hypothetical protein